MINLLVQVPTPGDATSLYRAIGPLGHLIVAGRDLRMENFPHHIGRIDWSILKPQHLLFMQRPYRPEQAEAAGMARLNEKPVWIDYDDWLFELTSDNPAYDTYMNEKTRKAVVKTMCRADVITVSTPYLARLVWGMLEKIRASDTEEEHVCSKVVVIPNALDEQLFKKSPVFGGRPHVVWRGSNTHARDWATYAEAFIPIVQQNRNWTFTFVGWNPWLVTDHLGKNAHIASAMDPIEYHKFMRQVQPSIVVAPLDDHRFNRCKSNIAWIEGTYGGAATLAPDWEEWRQPGVTTFRDPKEFGEQLLKLMAQLPKLGQFNQMSWERIQERFTLKAANQLRWAVIQHLVAGEPLPEQDWHEEEEGQALE